MSEHDKILHLRLYHRHLWRLGRRWDIHAVKPLYNLGQEDEDVFRQMRLFAERHRRWEFDYWTTHEVLS